MNECCDMARFGLVCSVCRVASCIAWQVGGRPGWAGRGAALRRHAHATHGWESGQRARQALYPPIPTTDSPIAPPGPPGSASAKQKKKTAGGLAFVNCVRIMYNNIRVYAYSV